MTKSGSTCRLADLGLLLIRLVVAAVFIFHGSQKVFGAFDGPGMAKFTGMLAGMHIPQPAIAAWLCALTELVGGVLVGIGLLTRLAAIPMAFSMAVAIHYVHAQAFSGKGGMEFPLTLAVVLLGLILTGPGCLSVDKCLFCRRCAEKPAEPTPMKK